MVPGGGKRMAYRNCVFRMKKAFSKKRMAAAILALLIQCIFLGGCATGDRTAEAEPLLMRKALWDGFSEKMFVE